MLKRASVKNKSMHYECWIQSKLTQNFIWIRFLQNITFIFSLFLFFVKTTVQEDQMQKKKKEAQKETSNNLHN